MSQINESSQNLSMHDSANLSGQLAQAGDTVVQAQGEKAIVIGRDFIYQSASKDENKLPNLNKNSPYKGLNPFDTDDANYFFGRDEFTAELLDELEQTNFILLLGASGSGKSSVVRAGLIPKLEEKYRPKFVKWIFKPDLDPFESMYRTLPGHSQTKAENLRVVEVNTLNKVINDLKRPDEFWLIFIDQLEELFTISNPEKSKCFIRSLEKLSKERASDSTLKIVATMRSDFLNYLDPPPANLLIKLNQNRRPLIITQMQPNELQEAIEKPAAQHGVRFEAGLVEKIIKDVQGQAGYLPLLQYTLDLLWEEEKNDKEHGIEDCTLNISSYRQLGEVEGALQRHMNAFYNKLTESRKQSLQRIFLNLVDIGEDGRSRPVRRRAMLSDFKNEEEQKLLHQLINEKLLISDIPVDAIEKHHLKNENPTVEISHEILLTSWEKLKSWVDQNRQAITLKNRVSSKLDAWKTSKADGDLLAGSELEQVKDFRNNPVFKQKVGFSDEANRFIDASLKRHERQRRRTVRYLTIFSSIVSALFIFALYQLRQSQQQRIEHLAATSQALMKNQPVEATTNALTAIDLSQSAFIKFYQPRFSSAWGSLLNAIETNAERNRLLNMSSVNAVAISTDGRMIVSNSQDNTIQRWDAQSGKPIGQPLVGHTASVRSIAISANGKMIVTGSDDDTVRRWDAQTGQPIGQPLVGHKATVISVAISTDGKMIVTGSWDGTVRRWDAQTGQPIGQPLAGLTGGVTSVVHGASGEKWINGVNSVAISSDGKMIISGGYDRTVRRWDAKTGQPIGQPLLGPMDSVMAVAISADGKTIAAGSSDWNLWLWDAKTGQPIQPFDQPIRGHSGGISSITISADGKTIISGSWDGTVQRWDSFGRKMGQPLVGHTNSVTAVAISNDGKTIVSGGDDDTIRLWNAKAEQPIGHAWENHDGQRTSVAISPDSSMVVSNLIQDNTVRRWDAKTGQPIGQPLTGHTGKVNAVAISADGQIIVSGSDDKTVRRWNAKTGQPIGQPLTGHTGKVNAVAISADGQIIVSGSDDKTVRRWNAKTGQPIGQPLTGHTDTVNAVAISADGQIIVSGSDDKTVRRWNAKTGQPIGQPLTGHTREISSVAISPDGKMIVSASGDKTLRRWDAKTGQPIGQPLTGHSEGISSIAISADGKVIASVGSDGALRLWDADAGQPIGPALVGHTAQVWSVAISPDGKTIVSSGYDDTWVWTISRERWLQIACEQLHAHSLLLHPVNDVAKDAQTTCQRNVWSK